MKTAPSASRPGSPTALTGSRSPSSSGAGAYGSRSPLPRPPTRWPRARRSRSFTTARRCACRPEDRKPAPSSRHRPDRDRSSRQDASRRTARPPGARPQRGMPTGLARWRHTNGPMTTSVITRPKSGGICGPSAGSAAPSSCGEMRARTSPSPPSPGSRIWPQFVTSPGPATSRLSRRRRPGQHSATRTSASSVTRLPHTSRIYRASSRGRSARSYQPGTKPADASTQAAVRADLSGAGPAPERAGDASSPNLA